MFDEERPYIVLDDDATTAEERQQAWDIGAGLQAVDGLAPSVEAYAVVDGYVNGHVSYNQVEKELCARYDCSRALTDAERAQREADVSAARIMQYVNHEDFVFSPGGLLSAHGHFFAGLLPDRRWVGRWRTQSISKPEPVLGGRSVQYAAAAEIASILDYDFAQERARTVPDDDSRVIGQVLRFASAVWQVHPFREGNTRATAAYVIAYMRSLGVNLTNEPFMQHSRFFRDALVLDNAAGRLRDGEPLLRFSAALAGEPVT